MTVWGWLVAATAICFAFKVAGQVVPAQVLRNPRFAQVAGIVTVGLLAAMVMVQSFDGGGVLVLDARLAALAVAAVALLLRAPFIAVVLLGAAAAAAVRALGWG